MQSEAQIAYESIAKHHQLPAYQHLTAELDLDALEIGKRRILKEVAKALFDRVANVKGILEGLLQPERLLEMQEAEFLTDAERNNIAELLRHMMRLDRLMLHAELENTDVAYATYLNQCWNEWQKIKPQVVSISVRLEEGWNRPTQGKQSPHYLG